MSIASFLELTFSTEKVGRNSTGYMYQPKPCLQHVDFTAILDNCWDVMTSGEIHKITDGEQGIQCAHAYKYQSMQYLENTALSGTNTILYSTSWRQDANKSDTCGISIDIFDYRDHLAHPLDDSSGQKPLKAATPPINLHLDIITPDMEDAFYVLPKSLLSELEAGDIWRVSYEYANAELETTWPVTDGELHVGISIESAWMNCLRASQTQKKCVPQRLPPPPLQSSVTSTTLTWQDVAGYGSSVWSTTSRTSGWVNALCSLASAPVGVSSCADCSPAPSASASSSGSGINTPRNASSEIHGGPSAGAFQEHSQQEQRVQAENAYPCLLESGEQSMHSTKGAKPLAPSDPSSLHNSSETRMPMGIPDVGCTSATQTYRRHLAAFLSQAASHRTLRFSC
ncbi:uncharacterized protein LAESUDRAFT_747485 [Laetiporus sulphureus 93-53]|uniref:Uncharacterized protein n=1 Tax=Laetiporus sulphureus 93-53 TaxID=1314785 RepID=A0A165GVR5_9APHY|nr:uncharacterized protein LAESUDRAFT_747485 [Laetiporus sulphureus 93-53]KZT10888.1 hypothetical protein LAESUDRAFT_747485 [Laetiporus sulphureus 93-53]